MRRTLTASERAFRTATSLISFLVLHASDAIRCDNADQEPHGILLPILGLEERGSVIDADVLHFRPAIWGCRLKHFSFSTSQLVHFISTVMKAHLTQIWVHRNLLT